MKNKDNSRFRSLPDRHPLSIMRRCIFGEPLRSSSRGKEQLGFFLGLPILAVDALSSVAYATEEILLGLSLASVPAFNLSLPIAMMITLLLLTIITSYSQTVQAYPESGGAYIVSKNHLGVLASLIAGSSLLIDYILTVSVSITAGVRALSSAFPALLFYKTELSLLGILVLAWLNMRGIRESAHAVALPVLAYIVTITALGITGLVAPIAVSEISSVPQGDLMLDIAMIAIILRAFAGGCTAMTGIEAVANAGQMLAQPRGKNAMRILIALGITLSVMFMLMTLSTHRLGILPLENESVLSQITKTVWGDGYINQFVQILTAGILFLAANTAFVAFPNLMAMLAKDGWMPKQMASLGDRLVFTKGIVWLAMAAIFLVIGFKGDPHALIPLYAIGVFTAFTMSQTGMVRYWLYSKEDESTNPLLKHRKLKACINGFGASMTMMALIVTFEAKFFEGAFLVLIVTPIAVLFCYWVQKQYFQADANLQVDEMYIKTHPRLKMFSAESDITVIVPISRLHRGSFEALAFARSMTKDVRAVIVDVNPERSQRAYKDLEELNWGLDIIVIASPYRSVIEPIVEYIHQTDEERNYLSVVVLPELVPAHWWQNFLHNKTAKFITDILSWSEQTDNQARIIIHVPYYLRS